MPLASFLNLKLAGGIPTAGPLHLPFSLPSGHSDFLTAVFPTQLSLLLGPSLAILVTVVTLPYRDPLPSPFLALRTALTTLETLWSTFLLSPL